MLRNCQHSFCAFHPSIPGHIEKIRERDFKKKKRFLLQGAEVCHPELNEFYENDHSPFIIEIHQKHFPTHFGQDAKVPSRPSHEFCLEGGI